MNTPSFVIRPAQPQDAPAMCDLLYEGFGNEAYRRIKELMAEGIRMGILRQNKIYLVADTGHSLAGLCMARPCVRSASVTPEGKAWERKVLRKKIALALKGDFWALRQIIRGVMPHRSSKSQILCHTLDPIEGIEDWYGYNLVVTKELRRKGIASSLEAAREEAVRNRGGRCLFLRVRPTEASIAAHTSWGFTCVRKDSHSYDLWGKHLQAAGVETIDQERSF